MSCTSKNSLRKFTYLNYYFKRWFAYWHGNCSSSHNCLENKRGSCYIS